MKALILASLVSLSCSAYAQINPANGWASINCAGSQGFLTLVQNPNDIVYDLNVEGKHLSGTIAKSQESATQYQEAGIDVIVPETGDQPFISAILSAGTIETIPAHTGCFQTRLEPQCGVTIPASTYQSPKFWIDLEVDQTSHKFMMLDLNVPGLKKTLKTLGETTLCTVSGI